MPSVTTHSSTAHNASAAHKLRSAAPASGGSADAAADLTGNDPFAALLAEVAPSDAAPKTAGQGAQKGADKKDADENTPASPDGNSTQSAAKGAGANNAAAAKTANNLPAQQDPAPSAKPLQTDPSQIAATNAGKGVSEKVTDPSAATPGKSKDKAADPQTIVDAKTGIKDDTDATNGDVQPDAGSAIKPTTKEDGKAGKDSDDKKTGKKTDAKTDPNPAANAALIPMPAPTTASFQPITLTLSMSSATGHADDPVQDNASPAGVAPTGTASGQDAAKTKKPQTLANQTGLTDPSDQLAMSDVDDAAPKAGKTADPITDKKNTKPDPKQAGPQTPTKLNGDPLTALLKQPSRNDANPTPSSASQNAGSNASANSNAPQAAAPQIALATLAPAPTGGPAPLPGMPAPTQLPGATAPQGAQNTSATLQAAPQTPTAMTPNLGLFALNIATRAQNGLKQFDITMEPAELGQVNVSLSIDKTGKTEAHLSAERPQTLALLQQNSSSLRIALRDAGLNLAQNGLNFSLNGQNPQQHDAKDTPRTRTRALSLRAVAAVGAAQNILPVFSSTGASTRLDIHV